MPVRPVLLRRPRVYSTERVQLMGQTQLHNYITDYGDEERRQVRNFWQAYANRITLIDFSADTGAGGFPRYGYNTTRLTYYQVARSGRRIVVPATSIKLDIERFSNNICQVQRAYASRLINGTMSLQDWYEDTARTMKLSYRAVIDVARGSSSEMSELESQHFQEVMELQFAKLNSLTERIERGDKPLDGTLLNAACQLAEIGNTLFENWKLWEAKIVGRRYARRRLTHAEACHDTETRQGCKELARLGWTLIDYIIPIGEAACYGNCHCRMEFR